MIKMNLYAQTPTGRKLTGQVINESGYYIFFKKVKASKHFFRKIPSIGCDIDIIEGLPEKVEFVKVAELEKKELYYTSIRLIKEKGIKKEFGFGEQWLLPMQYWKSNLSEAVEVEQEAQRYEQKNLF